MWSDDCSLSQSQGVAASMLLVSQQVLLLVLHFFRSLRWFFIFLFFDLSLCSQAMSSSRRHKHMLVLVLSSVPTRKRYYQVHRYNSSYGHTFNFIFSTRDSTGTHLSALLLHYLWIWCTRIQLQQDINLSLPNQNLLRKYSYCYSTAYRSRLSSLYSPPPHANTTKNYWPDLRLTPRASNQCRGDSHEHYDYYYFHH